MNAMKFALLGTAALAAVTVSARADDLSDLKAQIEALNGRISQLEAAPAVPAGYQMLSVSEAKSIIVPSLDIDQHYGDTATNIGILPTADVPASTNIQWSGFVRAALVWQEDGDALSYDDESGDDIDIYARAELKVVGTTDTAVGEVGALVKLRADFDGNTGFGWNGGYYDNNPGSGNKLFKSPEAWGWWKMTPELTLGAGYTGSLGNIGYGYDGACNCYYTDNAPVGLNPGDTTQMRLSYASGPLSFAIALEDGSFNEGEAAHDFDDIYSQTSLGVAGEIKYSGDSFSGEVSGVWRAADEMDHDGWQVGVGVGFSLGDIASISMAAGTGHTFGDGFLAGDQSTDFWAASILASANLSDSVHAEIAFGHSDYGSGAKTNAVLAGIYYDPVSQLTIGLEAEHIDPEGSGSSMSADLVTVFRF